jgi:hypothetical protein
MQKDEKQNAFYSETVTFAIACTILSISLSMLKGAAADAFSRRFARAAEHVHYEFAKECVCVCIGGEKTAVETLTSPVAWLRRLVDVGMAGHHVARSVSRLAELLVAVEALPLVVLVLFLRHYKTK